MKYLLVLMLVVLAVGSLILLNTIYPVLPGVANFTREVGQSVADNWRGFLSGKKDNDNQITSSVDDAVLAAKIKAEVEKAITNRIVEITEAGGVVVVPTNSSSTVADISKSFADEINVTPDDTGQSGVIRPVFRDGLGSPYLYVLTPIKQ